MITDIYATLRSNRKISIQEIEKMYTKFGFENRHHLITTDLTNLYLTGRARYYLYKDKNDQPKIQRLKLLSEYIKAANHRKSINGGELLNIDKVASLEEIKLMASMFPKKKAEKKKINNLFASFVMCNICSKALEVANPGITRRSVRRYVCKNKNCKSIDKYSKKFPNSPNNTKYFGVEEGRLFNSMELLLQRLVTSKELINKVKAENYNRLKDFIHGNSKKQDKEDQALINELNETEIAYTDPYTYVRKHLMRGEKSLYSADNYKKNYILDIREYFDLLFPDGVVINFDNFYEDFNTEVELNPISVITGMTLIEDEEFGTSGYL